MLVILYIIWLIYTVIDIKECFNFFKPEYALGEIQDASACFIAFNIISIFLISLCKFLEVL